MFNVCFYYGGKTFLPGNKFAYFFIWISISIYGLKEDFEKKGIAKFNKLKPEAYFILARKADKDNAGGGEKIGKLEEGKFNKVTIIIQ